MWVFDRVKKKKKDNCEDDCNALSNSGYLNWILENALSLSLSKLCFMYVNQRKLLKFAVSFSFSTYHGPFHTLPFIMGVNIVYIFVNKSIALHFVEPILAHKSTWRKSEYPKVSVLLSLVHRPPAGLFSDTGPRGEWNVHGASQLGLVYFPLLSNKRHFLVLMAWKRECN